MTIQTENNRKYYKPVFAYAPLTAYLTIYVLTCLLPALVLLSGYEPFLILIKYFSGVYLPDFTEPQKVVLIVLLIGAPILFALGYQIAILFMRKRIWGVDNGEDKSDNLMPASVPILVFSILALIGSYDLVKTHALFDINAWFDYRDWVHERWKLFSGLGFFDFVNLYLFVPISAAWVLLGVKSGGWKRSLMRWLPVIVTIILNFFLFQKKATIVSIIIMAGAVMVDRIHYVSYKKNVSRHVVLGIGAIILIYLVLVVIPVYKNTSRAMEVAPSECALRIDKLLGPNRKIHLLVYSLMAPFTRTSAPAIFYPIVFPKKHAYYGLDLGQDILGWGAMPDDFRVVWNYMYPNTPGAVSAPFQFTVFSQVGAVWALILSSVLGLIVGVLWWLIIAGRSYHSLRCLAASAMLLFSIYITIDSARNSIVSSYGVIWLFLFIFAIYLLKRLMPSIPLFRRFIEREI